MTLDDYPDVVKAALSVVDNSEEILKEIQEQDERTRKAFQEWCKDKNRKFMFNNIVGFTHLIEWMENQK